MWCWQYQPASKANGVIAVETLPHGGEFDTFSWRSAWAHVFSVQTDNHWWWLKQVNILTNILNCKITPAFCFQIFWYLSFCSHAFSALTLLVGRHEGHTACENWVVGCWRGYLSGSSCRLAYGPADATATHCLLLLHLFPHFNPDWFYFFGTSLPRLSSKRGH